jgi:hypothetical protein
MSPSTCGLTECKGCEKCPKCVRMSRAPADRFSAFVADLEALCVKHGVHLSPSMYDSLQVWDADVHCETLHFPDIQNRLK